MKIVRELVRKQQIAFLLLLSIIPVLGFGTFSYVTSIRMVESEVQRTSEVAIAQIKDQVDQLTRQIEEMAGSFSLRENVSQFVKTGSAPALGTLQLTNELIYDLGTLAVNYNAVDSIYLYHEGQRMVISSKASLSVLDQFGDRSWEEAMRQAAERRQASFWITPRTLGDGSGRQVLTYVRLLPYFYEQPAAAIVINVKISMIAAMIGSYPFNRSENLLVFAPGGELVVQTGHLSHEASAGIGRLVAVEREQRTAPLSKVDTEEGGMYLTRQDSPYNGFAYALLVPSDALSRSAQLLKWLILTATGVLSLLSVAVAYFNVKRFQDGVRRLLATLKGKQESSAADGEAEEGVDADYAANFARIETRVAALLQEVSEVRSQWKSWLPALRDHFLLSALLGNYAATDRWLQQRPMEMPPFPHQGFAVLVAEMDAGRSDARFKNSGSDTRLFLFAVANISRELVMNKFDAETVISHNHVAVILNIPPEMAEPGRETVRAAESIRYAVASYLKQTVTIAVGGTVQGFRELSASYQDAMRTLQSEWVKSGDEVLIGGKISRSAHPRILYPAELENGLLTAVREGERQQALCQLNAFLEELQAGKLEIPLVKTYAMQLLVSILRLLQDYDPELTRVFGGRSPYEEFSGLGTPQALGVWFAEEIVGPSIDFLSALRQHRLEEMMEKTRRLIEQRYAEDLSLQLAADQLGVSPSHLSELIKQNMGETFISYVTKFRISKVKSLLLNTELNIADIAQEVGYGNATHLIRVFKKSEGMTPGEYRLRNR
ncbi:MAG: AraC family transcriptional regulator [Paenibacillaceae bacterium]|jgi:AraC-like DNA-binding protein|nr:AraC family transcriptional regulator [Paenibacillaceae bacterium]